MDNSDGDEGIFAFPSFLQYRLKDKAASTLGLQAQNYEARLTELDCVIAELKKQLDYQRENIILEESTEDDNEMARDEEEDGGEILHQEELDEYPALPTLPEDIMSAPPAPFTSSSSTFSSSSSTATSKANSPDKPTAGGTGATPAVPVSKSECLLLLTSLEICLILVRSNKSNFLHVILYTFPASLMNRVEVGVVARNIDFF